MEQLSDTSDSAAYTPVMANPLEGYFNVLCLINDFEACYLFSERYGEAMHIQYYSTKEEIVKALESNMPVDVVVADEKNEGWELLQQLRRRQAYEHLPYIMLVNKLTRESIKKAKALRADDIYSLYGEEGDLLTRLQYLSKRQYFKAQQASRKVGSFRFETPWWKRTMDVVVTSVALVCLSPILLLVVLLIRLDSRGPILYRSKRVGSGYTIFNLYKFRTMRTDADKLIAQMASLSMYNKGPKGDAAQSWADLCIDCTALGKCQQLLFSDNKEVCERLYKQQKDQAAAFMKFQNDPRITRVGKFLRNTSLDELPQLINILKGDMSLVGNRPLPLYEAEKLTTDDKILRFAGPGGLTGLWQVTKRGKGAADMSEEERIELDITYVKKFSFMMDMAIIFKTIPALFQSEDV
jgi:lipopolysaccharide/colanic/teichoic acid biosynthesis glycosyltransferase